MTGPLIAVPAYHLPDGRVSGWDRGAFAVPEAYVEAVRGAGGRAVLLTEPEGDPPGETLEPFDGLLLIGGGDVDPSRYGGQPSPTVYGLESERDALEIALLRAADRIRMPVLAICRGIQVMNVAFGGTLHQHLPNVPGIMPHGTPGGGRPVVHDVEVEAESRLFATTKSSVVSGTSHHHQGIDRLGEGLVATGRSRDGLVEAIEREQGWMLGVQWHPEETADLDEAQRALFEGLIVLARAGIPGEPPRKARLTRPVELAPSDPSWPSAFEEEARRIQATLGGAAVRVDHVGSTAIPGLAAKPVIDIQVSVRSMEPRRAYVEPLVALGYRHVGDPASPDHEYFSRETEGERSHQVHVCLSGSEWERRHLLFRDELRRNPDLAAAYERLKRELAEAHPRDVYAYVEGKTDFVRSVEDRVLGAPPPVERAAAGGHDGEDPRG